MTTKLTFKGRGFTGNNFSLYEQRHKVGAIQHRLLHNVTTAVIGGKTLEFVKVSAFGGTFDVRRPNEEPFARYKVLSCKEAAQGSIKKWVAQLFKQTGVIELDSQTYRFEQAREGLTSADYTWSSHDSPQTPAVHYHHQTPLLSWHEQGDIHIAEAVPPPHQEVLVPLGLILAHRQSDANGGSVVAVS